MRPEVMVPVVVKFPITVEEACDTKPFWNVARPVTPSVEPKVLAPETANVPTFAACEKRFVLEAVVAKKFVEVAFVSMVLPALSAPRFEVPVTPRVPPKRPLPVTV